MQDGEGEEREMERLAKIGKAEEEVLVNPRKIKQEQQQQQRTTVATLDGRKCDSRTRSLFHHKEWRSKQGFNVKQLKLLTSRNRYSRKRSWAACHMEEQEAV